MTLPPKFPFEVKMIYDGKERASITEESVKKIIRTFDPDFDQREICRKRMQEEIFYPLSLFLHKYPILKTVLHEGRVPINVTLFTIIEDALKQNITELSETMDSFIKFLDECKGKYSVLFKRQAQSQMIEVLISSSLPDKQKDFKKRGEDIDLKREMLFEAFNHKGNPTNESFDVIKDKVDQLRQHAKNYRDRISAHRDKEEIIIIWKDFDATLDMFKELVCNFYTIFSFEMGLGDAQGLGFYGSETIKSLVQEIYR